MLVGVSASSSALHYSVAAVRAAHNIRDSLFEEGSNYPGKRLHANGAMAQLAIVT